MKKDKTLYTEDSIKTLSPREFDNLIAYLDQLKMNKKVYTDKKV